MFPRIGDGFWADLKINEKLYLRLFATETGLGPGAAIYDVIGKRWLPNREWADSIEDAQQRAERLARGYYRATGVRDPLPAVVWKKAGEQ